MRSNWKIASGSVIGKSHLVNDLPSQDAFNIRRLTLNWGIAILSDGAGSFKFSHLGSSILVKEGISIFSAEINKSKSLKNKKALCKDHWRRIVLRCFNELRIKLETYATEKGISIKELSSTIIVIIFSPWGIMSAHIGDGRAAYCNAFRKWQPIMIPFTGSQAGTTVFFTSDVVWDNPDLFIETRSIKDSVTGFSLLSDGCEKICFECYVKALEKDRYYDPNKPFPGFFNSIGKSLLNMSLSNWTHKQVNEKWKFFLENGNETLVNESDDKTLIVGILKNSRAWQEQ